MPGPGTHIIHTGFLLLGLGEGQAELQGFLVTEPGHRADRSSEDPLLVLGVAGGEGVADVVGVLPKSADAHRGP